MDAYDAAIENAVEFALLVRELRDFKSGTDYDQYWGAAFNKRLAALALATGKTREVLINQLWVAASYTD